MAQRCSAEGTRRHLPVRWLYTPPGRGICDLCSGPLASPMAEVYGYDLRAIPERGIPISIRPMVMSGPFVLCLECQKAVGIAPGDDQVELARLERRHRWAWRRFFTQAGFPIRGELLRLEVVEQ